MTKEEALKKLQEILERQKASKRRDLESDHIDADDVLCNLLMELGCEDVVEAWHKIYKWYA